MNAKRSSSKSGKDKSAPVKQDNGWTFATAVFTGLLQLANSNRIYPFFMMIIVVISALIIIKLPGAELAQILNRLLDVLTGSKGLLWGWLISTNLMWFVLLRKLRSIYLAEIERLAQVRNELLVSNGGSDDKLLISKHRSSEDAKPCLLVPGRPKSVTDD